MLAAYLLDKRFERNCLTRDGITLASGAIIEVALKSGCLMSTISRSLPEELERYIGQAGSFSSPAPENLSAAEWWHQQPNATVLKTVALRLATLKSSSANTERIFSVLKLVQSPVRNRFALDTLQKMAKIKICMKDAIDIDDFDVLAPEDIFVDDDDELANITERAAPPTRLTSYNEYARSVYNKLKKLVKRPPATITPRSTRVECLDSAELRENHDKFCQLIDFAIVNEPEPQHSVAEEPSSESKDSILKKIRGILT